MSNREQVQAQFGQHAEQYVTSEEHARGSNLVLAIDWLQPTRTDNALDVATGGGHMAKALAPLVSSVAVTDVTPPMLSAARRHLVASGVLNTQYVIADAQQLPFLDSSFDIVTCRIAAHHFPHPQRFLVEAARVLRPGGRFLLVDNVAPDDLTAADFLNLVETIRDPSHVKCLSVGEWRRWLEQAGLPVSQDCLRQKRHTFDSWVDRMAPTPVHRTTVSAMLLTASQALQDQFEITVQNGAVVNFTVDEWMAIALKA